MSAQPRTGTRKTSELLADRAYAALRDRIVQLRIAPGAPINEDQLGRELEMGRTPVREAIKRLALENLVTVFPRRGTFASEINITDLAHISDVRQQLEGHAAYRAAERLTTARRGELEALVAAVGANAGAERGDRRGGPRRAHRARRRDPPLRPPREREPVPRGDARALLQPVAAHLVPRARPAAAPHRARARAPRAARGRPRRRLRPRAGDRRRARRHVRDRDPQRPLSRPSTLPASMSDASA